MILLMIGIGIMININTTREGGVSPIAETETAFLEFYVQSKNKELKCKQ